jgi:protocatechuate 3,4-dioxygenase beta subunit
MCVQDWTARSLYMAAFSSLGFVVPFGLLAAAPEVDRVCCMGTVTSGEARPVKGANVWVVRVRPGDWPGLLAKTTTNSEGQFAASVTRALEKERALADLPEPAATEGPDWRHPPVRPLRTNLPGYEFGQFAGPVEPCIQVWARAEANELGWSALYPMRPSMRCNIVLQPNQKRRGRVVDHEDQPIGRATVRPIGFPSTDGSGYLHRRSHGICLMPREWSLDFAEQTDDAGGFETDRWPHGDLMVAAIHDGYAELGSIWQVPHPAARDDAEPRKIRLVPSKPMRGEVRTLHLEEVPRRIGLRYCRLIPNAGFYLARTTSGDDGQFVFENAPLLKSMPRSRSVASDPWPQSEKETFPPEILTRLTTDRWPKERPLVIAWREARVCGRVADEQSGLPIPGAEVRFSFRDEPTGRFRGVSIRTDGVGRFAHNVPVANHRFAVNADGRHSLSTGVIDWQQFRTDQPLDLGDLTARPQARVTGKVCDETGKPVPLADVFVDVPMGSRSELTRYARTGPHGKFMVPVAATYNPHQPVTVRARKGDAVSAAAQIAGSSHPGRAPRTVTLTIRRDASVRLSGTIVDAEGSPLAGRPVVIWREYYTEKSFPREQSTHGQVVEIVRSGTNGRFRSGSLWPDAPYYVQVRGSDGHTINSHRIVPTGGSDTDVGRIVVASDGLSISGKVCNASNEPVSAAAVQTSGRAGSVRSATTGADGRFEIAGLPESGEVIFVDHPGFRPAARIVRDGHVPLTVRLMARDDTSAGTRIATARFEASPSKGKQPAPSPATEKLARRAIAKLRELPEASQPKGSLLVSLGRIDPVAAIEWFAESTQRYGCATPVHEAFVQVAGDDPDRALDLMESLSPADAAHAAGKIAAWYEDRKPEKARPFVDRFLTLFEHHDGWGNRADFLAAAGHWKVIRGERDAGMELIAQAADRLETAHLKRVYFFPDDMRTAERLVEQHAPDSARALAELKSRQARHSEYEWEWAELRADSVRKWLDRAEAKSLSPPSYGAFRSPSWDVRILESTARHDPKTARRLAALLRAVRHRAGYRRTLVALALWDRRFAWDVIDEDLLALRRIDDLRWYDRVAPKTRFEEAARLVVAADDVGYPDRETLAACCVASFGRVTGPPRLAPQRIDSLLSGLSALAIFAPDEARCLAANLRPAVPRSLLGTGFRGQTPRYERGVSRRDWYITLALTDPNEMMRRLDEEIAYFQANPPKMSMFGGARPAVGIGTVAEVWTTSPERYAELLGHRPGW